MSSNAVWFTYHLEFDLVAQAGAVTEQACKQAVRDLALDQKVQVIPLKTPRTRTVYGVDVRYAISGPQMLTAAQIAALDAQLRSVFAMYFVDATPDPLYLFGGGINATDGLVLETVLPYVSGKLVKANIFYSAELYGFAEQACSVVANLNGNEFTYLQSNSANRLYTRLYINSEGLGGSPTITIPAADDITIKDAANNSLLIQRTRDIVVTPILQGSAFRGFKDFFIDTAGKLYLASGADADVVIWPNRSFEEAVASGAW